MKHSYVFFTFVIVLSACSPFSSNVKATPTLVRQANPQVDQIFSEWDNSNSPGCALGVIHKGQLIYRHNYGMAQPALEAPNSDNTVFYIGSMAKQFTAMSILLLVEQGRLSLDDNIRKYIPEFSDYGFPITIQHLLHHTSGITDYLLEWIYGGDYKALADVYPDIGSLDEQKALDLLTSQTALDFIPGTQYAYSNSNYFLLGLIVKRVSGQSLPTFADENIFKPLGMRHTQYRDDLNTTIANLATGHVLNAENILEPVSTTYHLVGDGGMYTTLDDLYLWDQNFYHNQLGKKDQHLIDQIYERGRLNNGDAVDYGFGVGHYQKDGLDLIEHGGQWIGFKNDIARFPDQQLTVMLLCNSEAIDAQQLSLQVAEHYLYE